MPSKRNLSSFSLRTVVPRIVENSGELEAIIVVLATPIRFIAKRKSSDPSPIAKIPPIERTSRVFLSMLLSSFFRLSLDNISSHTIMLRINSLTRFKKTGDTLRRTILRIVILIPQEREAIIAAIKPLTMCLL